jgi:beta-glucosidase
VEPRFPFGFGLSYTRFSYAALQLSSASLGAEAALEVSCELRNVGERAGAEVVQLYVSALEPALARPVKELAGFHKVWLEPGQATRVVLRLERRALEYYDAERRAFRFDPGRYAVSLGPHAAEQPLRAEFQGV